MANININFNIKHHNQNKPINNNNIKNNPINNFGKIKKNINNRILPKLKLDGIKETNFDENRTRKNKRNKTTLALNFVFHNKNIKEEKEKENEEKEINKINLNKRQNTSATKTNIKNYFSKSDFMYFN